MRTLLRLSLITAAAAAASACSTVNPPLLFGDQTNFGVHLGSETAASGMSVSVGYKQRSVAVVPVTLLEDDGQPSAIKAQGPNGNKDALSVFAVFEGGGMNASGSRTVRAGQMFSTGLAAQALTLGYQCQYRKQADCPVPAPERLDPAALPAAAPAPARSIAAAAGAGPSDRPYQRPLVYARTDVIGFDIGGSTADQGLDFTFGYSGRNLAAIPVASLGAGGRSGTLTGHDSGANGKDTFSVFGQFKSSTETARLGFGLERFFATGIAAQNLAGGLQDLVAKDRPAAPAAPVAADPAPVDTAKAVASN